MEYIVKEDFADLRDDNHLYRAGDNYPRPGFEVPPERLAELAGSDNRVGRPLIEAVGTVEAVEGASDAPDDEGREIPVTDEKRAQRLRRSRQRGNTDD